MNYVLSLALSTFFIVYIFQTPFSISEQLAREYYVSNPLRSFALDLVLVFLYIAAAKALRRQLAPGGGLVVEALSVVATSVLISGVLLRYLKLAIGSSFFHRWARSAPLHVIVSYDALLVLATYLFMNGERLAVVITPDSLLNHMDGC